MSFATAYRGGHRALSFELFPPKKSSDVDGLASTVEELVKYQPTFFTCTYGAGGSSQGRTLEVIKRVQEVTGLPVASHLTCVGSTIDDLRRYLQEAIQCGVDSIVALRGDPPKGETSFSAVEGGLRYANELVELIRSEFASLSIAVAGYPEVHQEAPNAEVDLANLKRKVDAGADAIITQLFYDNADFFAFRDRVRSAGIDVPLIPGLLPITNLAQAQRITTMCKSKLPPDLVSRLQENDSPQWQFDVGVDHARRQTIELMEQDVEGLHLYVLNRSKAAAIMLEGLEFASV